MCKHFVVLHKELGDLQTFVIHSSKLSLNQSLAGKKELDGCLYDKKTALTINKSCCHIGLRLPKIYDSKERNVCCFSHQFVVFILSSQGFAFYTHVHHQLTNQS